MMIVCLIASVFAGFIPFISQAIAGPGDSVQTTSAIHGDINCKDDQHQKNLNVEISINTNVIPDTGLPIEINVLPEDIPFTELNYEIHDLAVKSGIFHIRASPIGRPLCGIDFNSHFMDVFGNCVPGKGGGVVIRGWDSAELDEPDGVVFFGQIPTNPGQIVCHDGGAPISSFPIGSCLTGTQKNDNLIGSSGNDCIDGKRGNDKISGLAGNDKVIGGDGKDLLVGGKGNDELTGGKGTDSFQCGAGNDKITDFNPSEGDKKTSDCEQFGHGLGDASGGFQ